MIRTKLLIILFYLATGYTLFAQQGPPVTRPGAGGNRGSTMIDDSTRNIYGPATTLYSYEKNIVYQLDTFKTADTTVIDFHKKFHPLDDTEYTYHDLGNLGTPLNPIFPSAPKQIGATMGINVFDYYLTDPYQIKHYDTKSPFSWFDIVWGGGGRAKTEVGYTRNVNHRWNFGANYKGYFADKQVERLRRGDRNAESVGINLYTSFRSKNEKYRLFGTFDHTKHEVFDQGGIFVADETNPELYFSEFAGAYLNSAKTTFAKNNIHLYHHYQLADLFRLFHTADREKRSATFFVNQNSSDINFFDHLEIPMSGEEEYDFTKFTELSNKAGINGSKPFFYYSLYLQRRDVKMSYDWLNADSLGIDNNKAEHYAGGEIGMNLKEWLRLNSEGKVMAEGSYLLDAKLTSKWFEAKASISKYQPSFYQQAYRGQFDFWKNNFSPSTHTYYKLAAKLGVKGFMVIPHVEYNYFGKYITYKKISDLENVQNVFPIQANGNIETFMPGISVSMKYKGVHWEGTIKNTQKFGASAFLMPIPEWFLYSRLTLHTFLFKENLEIHTGVHVHWKSDYYGMAYDPAIQQFYVQNEFLIPEYWLTGVFLNAKIKRGLVFVRFNNLRQLLNPVGFFSTPHYRGESPLLDFGFKMPFYD